MVDSDADASLVPFGFLLERPPFWTLIMNSRLESLSSPASIIPDVPKYGNPEWENACIAAISSLQAPSLFFFLHNSTKFMQAILSKKNTENMIMKTRSCSHWPKITILKLAEFLHFIFTGPLFRLARPRHGQAYEYTNVEELEMPKNVQGYWEGKSQNKVKR